MSALPTAPIPPAEFFEHFLPRAFAEAEIPPEVKAVELALGVQLEGEGGGQWLFRVEGGALSVRAGSREEAAFSIVQSVEDWRGALWEGRGGLIGRQSAAVYRPHEMGRLEAASGLGVPGPSALARMQGLDGLVRVVVTGGEGGDWAVGLKLGPGPLPAEPSTTLCLAAADVAAMERGELNPLEAFMAGRIQVDGDLALMMQMQAAALQGPGGP